LGNGCPIILWAPHNVRTTTDVYLGVLGLEWSVESR
jgi:hypothetical protein